MKIFKESFWIKLVGFLPKPLIMWCYVRVANHATTGKYSDTVVPEITMVDVLGRYQKGFNL